MGTSPQDRSLRIALVHTADQGGGAETVVLNLHRALRRKGHQSRLYVGRKRTDEPDVVEIRRFRTVPGLLRVAGVLERRFGLERLYAPWFRHLDRELSPLPDIVHLHTLWGGEAYGDVGALPRLSRRFPLLMTLHESWLLTGHCACPGDCLRWQEGCGRCPDLQSVPAIARDGSRLNWMRKYAAVHRAALRLTVPSGWMAQMVRESPIARGKQVAVVPNGFDETVFCPGDRGDARRRLGVADDRFAVLLLAKNLQHGIKGMADAVAALHPLADDRKLVVLAVGEASQQLVDALPVPGIAIPFQADRQRLAHCYRAADLTLFPSHSESFGMIAVESQACGTPVLAYASGGLTDAVRDGVGGVLVPTGEITALTAHLRRLMGAPQELSRLGREGAAWAVQHFSSAVMADAFIEQYRLLLGK